LQSLRDEDGRGLLVLYPIDRNSQPKPSAKGRVPLEADDDLIGVAFCFPTAQAGTEQIDTIQVDVSNISEDGDPTLAHYEDTEGSRDEVDLDDE
jgi:hypothetical protein